MGPCFARTEPAAGGDDSLLLGRSPACMVRDERDRPRVPPRNPRETRATRPRSRHPGEEPGTGRRWPGCSAPCTRSRGRPGSSGSEAPGGRPRRREPAQPAAGRASWTSTPRSPAAARRRGRDPGRLAALEATEQEGDGDYSELIRPGAADAGSLGPRHRRRRPVAEGHRPVRPTGRADDLPSIQSTRVRQSPHGSHAGLYRGRDGRANPGPPPPIAPPAAPSEPSPRSRPSPAPRPSPTAASASTSACSTS